MPFSSNPSEVFLNTGAGFKEIPIRFKDYLVLLDYTGREIRQGKPGRVETDAPSIIKRMGYTAEGWSKAQKPVISRMERAVGSVESIKSYCEAIGQRWIWQATS